MSCSSAIIISSSSTSFRSIFELFCALLATAAATFYDM